MNSFFPQAFEYLMKDEGIAFTNDPVDSGGPTKFGITKMAYDQYLGMITSIDVFKQVTQDMARTFYFDQYWKALSCDRMTRLGIAICIFDSGVLYGVGSAAIMVQKAISICGGAIKLDGVLGDRSVSTLNIIREADFLKAFHGIVLNKINSIISLNPKDEKYRAGWTNRADRLLTLNNIVPVMKA